jgi:hypothetical protein
MALVSTKFLLIFRMGITAFPARLLDKVKHRLLWDAKLPADPDTENLSASDQFIGRTSPDPQHRHQFFHAQEHGKLVKRKRITH